MNVIVSSQDDFDTFSKIYKLRFKILKKVGVDFDSFLAMVSSSNNYMIEPMCLPIIEKSRKIPREMVADPWDRLIAATSIHLNFPLISRDETLRELKLEGFEVVW